MTEPKKIEPVAWRRRLQFVWWWDPVEWRFAIGRFSCGLRFIYRWWVQFGPLEVRRWENRTVNEIRAMERLGGET